MPVGRGTAHPLFIPMSDLSMPNACRDHAPLSSKFRIGMPKLVRDACHEQSGRVFAFIPKGTGVLLVPVPELAELSGIAKGAKAKNYRDRNDRV